MTFAIIISALGAFLGFANPVLHIPGMVLLFPAGLIWIGTRAATPKKAFYAGLYAGWLGAIGVLYWTVVPVHYYGNVPWILALPCPVVLGFVMGLYSAFFAWFLRLTADRHGPFAQAVYAGCLWATIEWARGILLTGFPWMSMASGLAAWPVAIQAVSIVGAFGLAGILSTLIALLLGRPFRIRYGMLSIAGFAALITFGFMSLKNPPNAKPLSSVGIIQGNIDQSLKWDPDYQEKTVKTYISLSEKLVEAHHTDVLIWPETALPLFFQDRSPLTHQVMQFVKQSNTPLLTGAPAYERAPNGDANLFNRAYLIVPNSASTASYDKQHLVPFGEYVPLKEYLTFISKLAHGIGDFAPGTSSTPLRAGHLAMGMLICYEAIFPELAQQRVENGANVLVNISNDAWFGYTSAPRQHLDLAILRAVEQGRYILRATNTGISTVIDANGRLRSSTPLFERTSMYYEQVPPLTEQTVYHRFYTVFYFGTPVLALLLLLTGLMRPQRKVFS
ncbi:apolipoprotein N-acyltransferase [Desulfovibrio inopinatus]|uniref:apolipoprotein N-acyltransferase n=1 Tax=Desulfovibrio inopinatus TaxID=102109 RepID=UPI000427513A|nr:apolipoprotein N-acyltransferase [Desulfovibrio inopinatus]